MVAGIIDASNLSGTNTGDQTLPTDFVSAASGGTFGGGLQINGDTKLGNRNTYAWWVLGLYVMSILDSYIDAHLSTFPVKVTEINDQKKK